MRRVIGITIGVVLIVFGAVSLVVWLTNLDRESRTESFEGVTTLDFDVANSPLEVVAEGDETVVDMSYTTGFFGADVNVEQSGGTLLIRQVCPAFFGVGCRASFHVSVPVGTEVTGSTSNGAIDITGTEGPVAVNTSNGAISLGGVFSRMSVRTSNGSITGADLDSSETEARTSNGRVELAFEQAPSSVTVQTSNGEVEVVVPSDAPAYAVTTSTSNGQVAANIRTDPSAPDQMDLRTSNGDITIRYAD